MEQSTSTNSPLWMRITLYLSLAVNVLILAAVLGVFVFSSGDRRADRPPRDAGALYMRALDPEDRRALRRDFVSGLAEQGRDRGAIVSDIQTTIDTLRASPFDADAFLEAMTAQTTRRAQRDAIGREVLAARIASMTEAERAAYADRVDAALQEIAERMTR